MENDLKTSKIRFNLLYLEYPEFLFNSLKAYGCKLKNDTKSV